MDLHVIDMPLTVHGLLWLTFFGWCYFMLTFSELRARGSGWVGHQEDAE